MGGKTSQHCGSGLTSDSYDRAVISEMKDATFALQFIDSRRGEEEKWRNMWDIICNGTE